ncbi:MAG: hypothetical protein ABSH35_20015 [Isosphaeraceae bacterium]|jgi:hypothetical protein
MNRPSRLAVALVCALWAVQGGMAQAQWGLRGFQLKHQASMAFV